MARSCSVSLGAAACIFARPSYGFFQVLRWSRDRMNARWRRLNEHPAWRIALQRIDRIKALLKRAYGALLNAESQYLFSVRQDRESRFAKELASDPLLVTPFGWSGYSQNDEDGIVQEVFRRIGTSSRKFLEFGAGDCLENTGVYLLLTGWRGTWLETDSAEVASIRNHFAPYLQTADLSVQQTFVTPDNIAKLIGTEDYDLIVIDIDGNDYYIWEAIQSQPRLVMIEYNATFRPPAAIVQPYSAQPFWHGENFYGASLVALEQL